MSEFKDYIEHGWKLVLILPGHKGPRKLGWNKRENCITDPNYEMRSAGLAHAYSGTCAIDVDDFENAHAWLAERGVDLEALFNAPDSVQMSSGRSGRGKLLYSLPEPMCSKKIKLSSLRPLEGQEKDRDILDFRCATSAGLTMQDVLPPSIHPDTAQPYKWVYGDDMLCDWREPPQIPQALYDIWFAEVDAPYTKDDVPEKGASTAELQALLKHQDPNMNRDDWVRVGMAIHHETDGGVEGLNVWDEWSRGSDKYVGRHDLEICWRSFHDTPNAVTVGLLRQDAVASPDEFPDIEVTPAADDPWAAAAQKRRERFSLSQIGEIASREPPEWIVDGLVPRADLAMMFGPPGSGKSFLALDLSFAVACGYTWFNRKSEAGPVVWIAAEAAGSMRNRARAYAQARGVQLDATDFWVIEQTLSLMSNEDAQAVTELLAEKKPALVVIDTLAAASGGGNENSGEDMNIALANCRKIHEATGALVLLVHHSGKDAARGARGWSGLNAAVDAEFEVSASESSPIRVLKVSKQRDGNVGDKLPFKLISVPLEFDDDTTSCVVEPLDEVLMDAKQQSQLGGNQKLVFKIAYELSGQSLLQDSAVAVQDVYDDAMIQMPKPPEGQRDRRAEVARRALTALHEKGYLGIADDKIYIGSAYNDEASED